MAKQAINIGSAPNDGTGDTIRAAFDKCNDNFNELYTRAYGSLLAIHSTAEQTGIGTTAVKFVGFTNAGLSAGMTPSSSANEIVANTAGVYYASLSMSFSGTISATFNGEVRVDGAPSNIQFERKLGVGGDVGAASCSGLLSMTTGQALAVYLKSDLSNRTLVGHDVQLTAYRLST